MKTIKREINLNRQLTFGAWQLAMAGDHQAAFRIAKALKGVKGLTYSKKAGTLKIEEGVEEITLALYPTDISWLFAQATKSLDGGRDQRTGEKTGPSPAVVDLCETWAEALGYGDDKSFVDRVQKFRNWYDSEPEEPESEKKPEDKPADKPKE